MLNTALRAMAKQNAKDIVIVGGSLGGLFAGTVLSRLGHKVQILERNPTPLLHDQGAGIVAGVDVQTWFEQWDRSSRTKPRQPNGPRTADGLVVTSHARQYLDRAGKTIHYEQRAQKMTSWDLLYYVLRAGYDRVDSEYVEVAQKDEGEVDGVYKYGCSVTGLNETNNGIRVDYERRLENGETESQSRIADLLVACDGGSSTVRKRLLPDVERKYAGYVAWRGTVLESD
jgi:2-polyprenyl-6-methoxyphenol hydroxylase-like FAD-dependent oxidoreductase